MIIVMSEFLPRAYRRGALPSSPLRRRSRIYAVLVPGIVLVLSAFLIGCTGNDENRNARSGDRNRPEETDRAVRSATVPVLRVAEQHGLAYAPLVLIRSAGEDRTGETGGTGDTGEDGGVTTAGENGGSGDTRNRAELQIEWIRVNNAAAVREAMLANRLDVGFMGIPPYLIGRDTATGWRAFTGLSRAPLGLVTIDPRIPDLETLAAPGAPFRIALPQPGSIQHILLAIALDRRFGDPTRLDHRLVSLGHPDGMNAMLSGGGDISAHFTSPPFLFEELRRPEATLLLSGEDAFGGEFTFIIGVLRPGLSHETPAVLAFQRRLQEAVDEITRLQEDLRDSGENGDGGSLQRSSMRTLNLLADAYEIDAEVLRRDLMEEGMVYEDAIRGMERFRDRMHAFGYISGETGTGVVE